MIEVKIACVEPPFLESCWPFVDKELDSVPHIWENWWTKQGLRNGIERGEYQLWEVGDQNDVHLFVFTTIIETRVAKILQCFLAVGNQLDKWLLNCDELGERLAQHYECTRIQIIGRPGWERKLRPLGFHKEVIIMEKAVVPRSYN